MFSIGSFAIIFDEWTQVLLCHRRDMDAWNLPGGRVEQGELPTEAVVRETREETGLEVTIERLVGVYAKEYKDELIFAFRCRVIGGRIRITDEADESRYFSPESLPPNTIPKHVGRIRDALAPSDQIVFRRQRSPSSGEWLQPAESEES